VAAVEAFLSEEADAIECQLIPECSIEGDTYKVVVLHQLKVAHGQIIGASGDRETDTANI